MMSTDSDVSEPEIKIPEEFTETEIRNRALEVNGKLLWVCPGVLAEKSPFFKTLFFSENFEHKKQKIIPLKDKNLQDVIMFLQILTDTRNMKDLPVGSHYEGLMMLADEFQAERAMEKIFDYMVGSIDGLKRNMKFTPDRYDVSGSGFYYPLRYPLELFNLLRLAYQYQRLAALVSFFGAVTDENHIKYWLVFENTDDYPDDLKKLLTEFAATASLDGVPSSECSNRGDWPKLNPGNRVRDKVANIFKN